MPALKRERLRRIMPVRVTLSWILLTTSSEAFTTASIFPGRHNEYNFADHHPQSCNNLRSNSNKNGKVVTTSQQGIATQVCRDVRNEQLKELNQVFLLGNHDGEDIRESPIPDPPVLRLSRTRTVDRAFVDAKAQPLYCSSSTQQNDYYDQSFPNEWSNTREINDEMQTASSHDSTATSSTLMVENATRESVHLQLQSMHRPPSDQNNSDDNKDDEDDQTSNIDSKADEEKPKVAVVKVHTYVDPQTNQTWVSLNTSRRKFLAFLEYNNVTTVPTPPSPTKGNFWLEYTSQYWNNGGGNNKASANNIAPRITTTMLSLGEPSSEIPDESSSSDCPVREEWRRLWKARRLLTDRTELLAVYQSDQRDSNQQEKGNTSEENNNNNNNNNQRRRGGFTDLLYMYTNRLVSILRDEQKDEWTPLENRYRQALLHSQQMHRNGQTDLADGNDDDDSYFYYKTDRRILVKWLEDNYGMSETLMLQARRFRTLPIRAQKELMNHFLEWFRKVFPYFYDRCDACGASRRDDLATQSDQQHQASSDEDKVNGPFHQNEDDDDDDQGTFLGYVYPTEIEVKGKASRTELYHCHKCGSFTRFPRFNSAFDIIQSRRGRCGEYSLLLYRFLRALNHDCRWVVDWADHVWAEVLIGDNDSLQTMTKTNGQLHRVNGHSVADMEASSSKTAARWIHLDPCEAAVDEPLLYESWGKKQTYIMALYAPLRIAPAPPSERGASSYSSYTFYNNDCAANHDDAGPSSMVEDVTKDYTSDSWDSIWKRRDEEQKEVESAIETAVETLRRKLLLGEDNTDIL